MTTEIADYPTQVADRPFRITRRGRIVAAGALAVALAALGSLTDHVYHLVDRQTATGCELVVPSALPSGNQMTAWGIATLVAGNGNVVNTELAIDNANGGDGSVSDHPVYPGQTIELPHEDCDVARQDLPGYVQPLAIQAPNQSGYHG